jgi:hypothetical protein
MFSPVDREDMRRRIELRRALSLAQRYETEGATDGGVPATNG